MYSVCMCVCVRVRACVCVRVRACVCMCVCVGCTDSCNKNCQLQPSFSTALYFPYGPTPSATPLLPQGLQFLVQSPKHPAYVEGRIEAFLKKAEVQM